MSSLKFPPRPTDGHKGTFGSVCILGGQRSEDGIVMLGAPTLAANAAMRSGCGTVMLGLPQPLIAEGITLAPTATGIELPVDDAGALMPSQIIELLDNHATGCSCFVIGPGFGSDWAQQQVVVALASREDRPIVLDADALNALSKLSQGQLDLRAPTIMTPHIGEYKRLAKSMGIDIDAENIEEAGAALAQAYGCVVVLKGHKTVVTDGIRLELCDEGGVELAFSSSQIAPLTICPIKLPSSVY